MKTKYSTIYIVRHGESIGNVYYAKHGYYLPNLKLGTDLSQLGIKQAQDIAKKLVHIHFDAIFSSDYIRAKRTAEIIALERKMDVITTKIIRERNLGSMEGKLTISVRNEIKRLQKGMSDLEKMKMKLTPDMESEEELITRFINFLREIAIAYSGKTILVVNHGKMMRTLLIHLGFAKYDELPHESIKNTGYIKLESDGVDFIVKETWGVNKQILQC